MTSLRVFSRLLCICLVGLLGCEAAENNGPDEQRVLSDAGTPDAPVATGLECESDDDCEAAERCKHYGQTSLCVLGCGSDDDCPDAQPTCDLYGPGDGLCVRRCRNDGMCAEDEVCIRPEGGGFGTCDPVPEVNEGEQSDTDDGSSSQVKRQCSSDANCPYCFLCLTDEVGETYCQRDLETEACRVADAEEDDRGGGGMTEGGGESATGGASGDDGRTAMGGSASGGAASEGGSPNTAGMDGMGGDGGAGGAEGGAGGNIAGEGGDGGMPTVIGGREDSILDQMSTSRRGYLKLFEKTSTVENSGTVIEGEGRFGQWLTFPADYDESTSGEIWPDPLRIPNDVIFGEDVCRYFVRPDRWDIGNLANLDVGIIRVADSAHGMPFELTSNGGEDEYIVNQNVLSTVYDVFPDDGAPLSLSAPGAENGRFGGFAVQMPSPQRLTLLSNGTNNAFSRAGETITWTPGNGSYVRLKIRFDSETIECDSRDDGTMIVPQEALAYFAAGTTPNEFYIERVVEKEILSDVRIGAILFRLSYAIKLSDFSIID